MLTRFEVIQYFWYCSLSIRSCKKRSIWDLWGDDINPVTGISVDILCKPFEDGRRVAGCMIPVRCRHHGFLLSEVVTRLWVVNGVVEVVLGGCVSRFMSDNEDNLLLNPSCVLDRKLWTFRKDIHWYLRYYSE